jgi:hypothetical protein
MLSFPRNLSLLAATAIVAAALSGPVPAFAADGTVTVTDISANGTHKASAAHVRRHGPMRVSHYVHPVRPAESNLGCSGVWCGRQFVLIVGIGY